MGNIVTDWIVRFGNSEANIAKVASDAAQLDASITDAAANGAAGFDKLSGIIAISNGKIKEAIAATNEHKNAQRQQQAILDGLKASYKDLDTATGRANASGNAALIKNIAAQKQVKAEIAAITQAIKEETAAHDAAKAAIDRETAAQKAAALAAKEAAAQGKAAAQAAASAGNAGAEGGQKAGGAMGLLNSALGSATGLFAGFFAVGKLKQLGSEIIDVTADFERYQAVLTTIFDGNEDKAKRQLSSLQAFAARTPFQLTEITEAYVQLQNRGIKPTEEQLGNLANLAAASGKGIGQAAEAVLAGQTGMFRNLKQFGVIASVEGDKVKVTFRGVTTELEKGSEALTNYLLGLGGIAGIAGSTDRISATLGGRISNLKDSFTELFAVIGEGSSGPLNFFIERISILARKVKEYLETTDSKAIRASAKGINDYGVIVDGIFTATAANAKKTGLDINTALAFSFAEQGVTIDKQLENQTKRAKIAGELLDQKRKEFSAGNVLGVLLPGTGIKSAELDEAEKINLEEQTRLKLLQGERGELTDRYKLIVKGNNKEAEILGLILALKEKIKKLDELREAKTTTRDDLLKKGGLNDQKDALEKELAILEGKKDKASAARGEKLRAALAALQAAELTLRKDYNKQLEDEQKGNLTRLAKLQYDHDIENIAQLKKTIIDKELAVKRAGGRGIDADGKLNAPQQKEVNKLTTLAQQAYGEKLAAIERDTNNRILELQADSDEKQLAQLTAKFDEEIRISKKAENKLLTVELEAAKVRQIARLALDQEQRQIEERRILAEQVIRLGQGVAGATPTETQVADEVDPAKLSRAQRIYKTIADARIDIEKNMQRQLLENQLNADRAQLAALDKAGVAITDQRRRGLAVAIQDGEKAINRLRTHTDFTGFLINLLGVAPEDQELTRAAFDEFSTQALSQINNFAQAQVEATRAVADNAKNVVQEKRSELDTEIQLNKLGFASNVEAKRAELKEARAARAEALKDQKEAQRAQILLESVQQAASLATASAKILEGFANIPVVGVPLGIAAVAAMIGFFVASKAKALSAVNAQTLEAGGYIGGRRHSQGGNKFVSLDGRSTVEHEAGEFVTKRRAASRWGHLLESINAEDENRMTQILFNDLLKGTGVSPPANNLPQRLQQAQASHRAATVQAGGASQHELASLRADVAAIRQNTQPQRQVVDTGSSIITTEANRTRIERK